MMPSLPPSSLKSNRPLRLAKEFKEKDQWMKIKSGSDWLRELDPYESMGRDGLFLRVLRHWAHVLAKTALYHL